MAARALQATPAYKQVVMTRATICHAMYNKPRLGRDGPGRVAWPLRPQRKRRRASGESWRCLATRSARPIRRRRSRPPDRRWTPGALPGQSGAGTLRGRVCPHRSGSQYNQRGSLEADKHNKANKGDSRPEYKSAFPSVALQTRQQVHLPAAGRRATSRSTSQREPLVFGGFSLCSEATVPSPKTASIAAKRGAAAKDTRPTNHPFACNSARSSCAAASRGSWFRKFARGS